MKLETETPCLKANSKFMDRPTFQTEAGVLGNEKLPSSESRGRQQSKQCMPAPL